MKDRINYYILLPLMFLVFFLETTFLAQSSAALLLPDLLLLLLLADVLLSASADFLYLAFFFGALADVFSGSNFGLHVLAFTLIALLAALVKAKFLREERFLRVALLAGALSAAYDLLTLFLLTFVFNADSALYADLIWRKLPLDGIFAAALIYPIMHLIAKQRE